MSQKEIHFSLYFQPSPAKEIDRVHNKTNLSFATMNILHLRFVSIQSLSPSQKRFPEAYREKKYIYIYTYIYMYMGGEIHVHARTCMYMQGGYYYIMLPTLEAATRHTWAMLFEHSKLLRKLEKKLRIKISEFLILFTKPHI